MRCAAANSGGGHARAVEGGLADSGACAVAEDCRHQRLAVWRARSARHGHADDAERGRLAIAPPAGAQAAAAAVSPHDVTAGRSNQPAAGASIEGAKIAPLPRGQVIERRGAARTGDFRRSAAAARLADRMVCAIKSSLPGRESRTRRRCKAWQRSRVGRAERLRARAALGGGCGNPRAGRCASRRRCDPPRARRTPAPRPVPAIECHRASRTINRPAMGGWCAPGVPQAIGYVVAAFRRQQPESQER